MSNTRGIFSLSDAVEKNILSTWELAKDTFIDDSVPTPIGNDAGYFSGGCGPFSTVYSSTDKIDFTTDTVEAALSPAKCSTERTFGGAVGSPTHGYIAGGQGNDGSVYFISSTDRCVYATDTTSLKPGAELLGQRTRFQSSGNSTHGYFCGGKDESENALSWVSKFGYTEETNTHIPSAQPSIGSRYWGSATGNQTNGYQIGGATPAWRSSVEKLCYGNETMFEIPSLTCVAPTTPANQRYQSYATGNETHGYVAGAGDASSYIDKLTYATDTTSTLPSSGSLVVGNRLGQATSSATAGYFSGGVTAPWVTNITKLDYATDTMSPLPATETVAGRYGGACHSPRQSGNPTTTTPISRRLSDNQVEVYYNTGFVAGGGEYGGYRSDIERVRFSNDTVSPSPTAKLSNARSFHTAAGNSTHAVIGGGLIGATAPVTNYSTSMDKLIYSTETAGMMPGGQIGQSQAGLAAAGNATHGYFGGGWPPSYSDMHKIEYASDTFSPAPGANITVKRGRLAAVGNGTNGYWSGGYDTGYVSITDKCVYSSTTTTQLPSAANGWIARNRLRAVGNQNNGYFTGGTVSGTIGFSEVDKLTYGTDTMSKMPGAPMAVKRFYHSATGSASKGCSIGGYGTQTSDPVAAFYSAEGLDYTTETSSLFPASSGSLSALHYAAAATSQYDNTFPTFANDVGRILSTTTTPSESVGYYGQAGTYANYGMISGGPSTGSLMHKIDFTTDTTSANFGAGKLPLDRQNKYYSAAVSSQNHGYAAGGLWPVTSSINKISYASETAEEIPATLVASQYSTISVGNSTNGYFGYGYAPSGGQHYTQLQKLAYSTDTMSLPGANTPYYLWGSAGVGNSTHGYLSGAWDIFTVPNVYYSTVLKLEYSSDTISPVPSTGDRKFSTYYTRGVGNSTQGYWMAGTSNLGPYSSLDKLVYSTDTTTAVPQSVMGSRYAQAATGNSTAGYFTGGRTPGATSETFKLTYATDTLEYKAAANLSKNMTGAVGTGPLINGMSPSTVVVYAGPNVV